VIRRLLLSITFTLVSGACILVSSCAFADDLSPNQFIEQVISAFNSENLADYQEKFHYPYSRIIDGRIEIFENQNSPAMNFSNLKKSGWVRSRVNKLQTLAISEQSAIVKLNFSRMNAEGHEYVRSNAFYTLTRQGADWKIISLSIIADTRGN
jgi:hypothetical protein